jgi:hypothetical protein
LKMRIKVPYPTFQQIALLDTDREEFQEKRLVHREHAITAA